ncbi:MULTISPECIES: hypothetical protein [Clostridium]|jgi:hypothetical protein|uniref:Uncharacterized protein n=2 Tax=Clostridium TaxID=1485 RepID=A0A151ALA9_9CLOT|nr:MULTISPECIES: hypothetical protein [Clostridium]KYH28413.1 hypothetical protein CLCOL_19050 [Clostridium colicanis DSM 13634]PRR75683.1 hypothetical protein CPAL_05140 [Clostridium thermopalmarium DSM 5974]PVZ26629.1 hypothetical protein LX19_00706 [Clostridium thermopalmarium DSM 5974]
MSIEEIPYRFITKAKTGFYDGYDYDYSAEIAYNDDVEISKRGFKDADEEPIENYYDFY